MYAGIRDQLAVEITTGVHPVDALLPSIREIMELSGVSMLPLPAGSPPLRGRRS
jgi:hypothetical protein